MNLHKYLECYFQFLVFLIWPWSEKFRPRVYSPVVIVTNFIQLQLDKCYLTFLMASKRLTGHFPSILKCPILGICKRAHWKCMWWRKALRAGAWVHSDSALSGPASCGLLGAVHIPWAFSQGWGDSHNNLRSLCWAFWRSSAELRQNEGSLRTVTSVTSGDAEWLSSRAETGGNPEGSASLSIFGKAVFSQPTRRQQKVVPSVLLGDSMRWNKGTPGWVLSLTTVVEHLVLSKSTPSFLMFV